MGKSSWFIAVFHRTWNGDRLACLRDHALLIAAALCMLCGYHLFVNKMGMKRLSANPFIPIYILRNYPFY